MKRMTPEISIHVQQDDTPISGNLIASGDDDYDRQVEDYVMNQLEGGNVWAWAAVTVTAEFMGVTASAYLGGCSYENEEDFKACEYYRDMVREATNELADKIADLQGIEIEIL